MYLHLGQGIIVKKKDVIGIFDIENTTVSKGTKTFLKKSQINGEVINVSDDLPKSFIIVLENGKDVVYISPISPATLFKRSSLSGEYLIY